MNAFVAGVMTKFAASALRKRVRVIERAPGYFEMLLGSKSIGKLGLKDAGARVQGASIDPAYRGMGLGKKLYGEVMRRMPGQRLSSDTSVSREAARVWRGMRRRGYRVKENPVGARAVDVAERYHRRFGRYPRARRPQFTAQMPRPR